MSYNYNKISNTPEERQQIIFPYVFWNDAFSSEELEKICEVSSNGLSSGAIGGKPIAKDNAKDGLVPTLDETVRTSQVAFNTVNDQNSWVFERLNYLIEECNNRWYNFDLNGYDQYQYTEYHSSVNGHYNWHVDTHYGPKSKDQYSETRKLSLTLLLNDPEEDFTGGEFQMGHQNNIDSVEMRKGTLILFPSFQLHRIAPVTKGVRKSLVVWVLGPKFK